MTDADFAKKSFLSAVARGSITFSPTTFPKDHITVDLTRLENAEERSALFKAGLQIIGHPQPEQTVTQGKFTITVDEFEKIVEAGRDHDFKISNPLVPQTAAAR